MDDPLNIQQPVTPKSAPTDQADNDQRKRVEPPRPDDRAKFARTVDKKTGSKVDDEEEGSLASIMKDDSDEDSSIFSLSRKSSMTHKKDKPRESLATGQNKTDISGLRDKEMALNDTKDDDDNNSQNNAFSFGQESRQDLFQLMSIQTQATATEFAQKTTSISKQEAADLATQMIEKMTTMKTQGDITTELTLKFPPLFEGAIVQIKESSNAPGQFNLSFQNLTAQAKQLIDQQHSRDTLKQTLQDKGYNVHIIVATTQIEKPEQPNFNSQDKGQQQQQQSGKGSGGSGQQQEDRQQ